MLLQVCVNTYVGDLTVTGTLDVGTLDVNSDVVINDGACSLNDLCESTDTSNFFLKDGSVDATGDFNLDGNNLVGVSIIRGANGGASDLFVDVTGGGDLHIQTNPGYNILHGLAYASEETTGKFQYAQAPPDTDDYVYVASSISTPSPRRVGLEGNNIPVMVGSGSSGANRLVQTDGSNQNFETGPEVAMLLLNDGSVESTGLQQFQDVFITGNLTVDGQSVEFVGTIPDQNVSIATIHTATIEDLIVTGSAQLTAGTPGDGKIVQSDASGNLAYNDNAPSADGQIMKWVAASSTWSPTHRLDNFTIDFLQVRVLSANPGEKLIFDATRGTGIAFKGDGNATQHGSTFYTIDNAGTIRIKEPCAEDEVLKSVGLGDPTCTRVADIISDGELSGAALADGSVTSAKLAPGAVSPENLDLPFAQMTIASQQASGGTPYIFSGFEIQDADGFYQAGGSNVAITPNNTSPFYKFNGAFLVTKTAGPNAEYVVTISYSADGGVTWVPCAGCGITGNSGAIDVAQSCSCFGGAFIDPDLRFRATWPTPPGGTDFALVRSYFTIYV